ncbi:hypothetical protein K1719_008987 [Acacia pycnantha]|nr:hypothetical protein K1719_008987 [Acacia pycnantha]
MNMITELETKKTASDAHTFLHKGILKGFDQATNITLDESHERVYSTKEGVQQLVLGLYIIRGDNISVVGELDEDLDASLDLSKLRAHPLKPA